MLFRSTLQNTDCHPATARPISTSFTTLTTDDNGLIVFTPPVQAAWGAVNVYSMFTVGAAAGQTVQTTVQIFQ